MISPLLGALGFMLAFGFGAAQYGDEWYSILRRW